MTSRKTLLAGLSALAFSFGAVAGVQAQEPAPAPQMEAPAAAPAVDDAKLKSFAVAFLEVSKVTESYRPQIEAAAGNTEDQQRIQQEAGEKMVEAVNASGGINVDEYNSIIEAAQTDPELAQRINGHITEVAGAAGGQPAEPAPPAQ